MPRVFCSGNPHQALVTILEHAQTLCCVVPLIEKNRLATSLLLSNDAGRGIGYFDQNSDQVAEGVLRVGCDNHGVSMGQSRIRSSPCTSCCSKKNRMNVGVFPQISSNLDEGRLTPKRHKKHMGFLQSFTPLPCIFSPISTTPWATKPYPHRLASHRRSPTRGSAASREEKAMSYGRERRWVGPERSRC